MPIGKPIRSLIVLLVSIILVSVSGCGQSVAKKETKKNGIVIVETHTVRQIMWQEQIHAVGTLLANQGIMIKPEVSGRITKIFFHSGEQIKKGAPLIKTNQEVFKAQLAFNQAKLTLSTADLSRKKRLAPRGAVAQSSLDQAVAAHKSDVANVARNQALLQQTVIRAPFDGTLGLRHIDVGQYIVAGQTSIVNLQDTNPMRVEFSVPEVYLNKLTIGEKIIIRSDSFPNMNFTGKVFAFESALDQRTRSIKVRAKVPNEKNILVPGSFAEITLYTKKESAIVIPETGILYATDSPYVYIVKDQHAYKRKVTLGVRRDNLVTVKQGLQPGETVVTGGLMQLINGSKVQIQKTETTS